MFDQETWRHAIGDRLRLFLRSPRQEIQLSGANSALIYLVAQAQTPFFSAFDEDPIGAVCALGSLGAGPMAGLLVRQAARHPYQTAAQVDRDLRASREYREMADMMLATLQTMERVRRDIQRPWDEWLYRTLESELVIYPGEFPLLRAALRVPTSQSRQESLRQLRASAGRFNASDYALLQESLGDSAAPVRARAARLLGASAETPPQPLVRALVEMALFDRDAEPRNAAARAIGQLRHAATTPQLLDMLADSLTDPDRFHRTAAALLLGQLGDRAGSPALIRSLALLLDDEDSYAREAAARALAGIGLPAATPEVILALTRATQDSEVQVHEAATDALMALRGMQSQDFALALSA